MLHLHGALEGEWQQIKIQIRQPLHNYMPKTFKWHITKNTFTVMQINTSSKTSAAKWIASDGPLLDTILLENNFLNFPDCLPL
jgi:hypothetical protein